MSRADRLVPEESSLLCEGCGYVLDGLPADGNCPECGLPMERGVAVRRPPRWEAERAVGAGRIVLFLQTTIAVIFKPTKFFRSLATRSDEGAARRFGMIHWLIASVLFAVAARLHVNWYLSLGLMEWRISQGGFVILTVATFGFLWLTTHLAAWLTAWEACYRGLRLSPRVVRRGLYYHAAHYLPVALMAAITVGGFVLLSRMRPFLLTWSSVYLYTLCAEVIVAAAYLFNTYWIGMRNMMYANR